MILRGLDIDDLLVLSMLLDQYTITQIAQNVHLTQPAITQRLSKMRRILGFAVTIRAGRNIVLTQAGLPVALAARECLIILLRSLPDGLGDWRRHVLVDYVLSKAGDRSTNKSYQS